MPTLEVQDEDEVILVEFAPAAGVRSVSLSPQRMPLKNPRKRLIMR